MTRIFSYTQPIEADIVDAYCALQKGFTDQFVYYDKERACRYMGLGRCIALPSLDEVECDLEGADVQGAAQPAEGPAALDPALQPPVFFSFNRFDAENPAPTDELFEAAVSAARQAGVIKDGDLTVITAGVPLGKSGTTNMMRIHVVGEPM